MKRSLVLLALMATLVVVPNLALAASPTPSTVYIGLIKSSPFEMKVTITVAKDGTSGTFSYLCGTGRAPTIIFKMPIDSTGHFSHTAKTGSLVTWKMAGHFTSSTSAFISLNSIPCGGSKGSTTMKPK